MDIKAYLDNMYYGVGKQSSDFFVSVAYTTPKGEFKSSKWQTYMEAQADENFITRCNQRTQLKNEINFEYDKDDFAGLIKNLEKDGIKFTAYATDEGRARRCESFWNGLAKLSKEDREEFREYMIRKYDCDTMLKGDKHNISFGPHCKTKKQIKIQKEIKGINSISQFYATFEELKRKEEKRKDLSKFIFDENKIFKSKIFPFCKLNDNKAAFGVYLPKEKEIYRNEKFVSTEQVFVPVLITSNNECYEVGKEFEKKNLVKFSCLPDPENYQRRWSLNSIQKYLTGDVERINGQDLFDNIKKQYEHFLYFSHETWYTVHALWDIGTYFFLLSKYYPLLELRGLRGTAKSKIMTLSRQMSFNATEEMTNPSEPTLFRDTHMKRPAKYIDEAEKLFMIIKGKVEPDNRAELINSSFKYTGTVPRQEKEGNRYHTVYFSTYSPTMIGSINGLYGATEDRAIIHITVKPPTGDNRGDHDPNEDDHTWQDIRNKLYIYALQNWKDIEDEYKNFKEETGLKNREQNIWKLILVIAKHIDLKIYQEILAFAVKLTKSKSMDVIQEGTLQYNVLRYTYECILQGDGTRVMLKDISDKFHEDRRPANKTISRQLETMGFREYRDRWNDGIGFRITKTLFESVVASIESGILSSFATFASLKNKDIEEKEVVQEILISEDGVKQNEAKVKQMKQMKQMKQFGEVKQSKTALHTTFTSTGNSMIIITKLLENMISLAPKGIPIDTVIHEAEILGIKGNETEKVIDKLKWQGDYFEPKIGFLQKI